MVLRDTEFSSVFYMVFFACISFLSKKGEDGLASGGWKEEMSGWKEEMRRVEITGKVGERGRA